jgi:hypothetical protein
MQGVEMRANIHGSVASNLEAQSGTELHKGSVCSTPRLSHSWLRWLLLCLLIINETDVNLFSKSY